MNQATQDVQRSYDRIASVYDLMQGLHERRFKDWRRCAWALVKGPEVLEVGVGTGRNFSQYPVDTRITGVDISPKMLARARERAAQQKIPVTLIEMDAQTLEFADHSFDSAIATCVFCSVPDPVLGLREMARVVKPGGRIVLLEHMRADVPLLGHVMDALDPIVSGMMGPHINRSTVENIRLAGLKVVTAFNLDPWGIFRLIAAHT